MRYCVSSGFNPAARDDNLAGYEHPRADRWLDRRDKANRA